MHHLQTIQQRIQNRFKLGFAQRPFALKMRRQRLALGIFHHDIGRTMRFKETMHLDDVAMVKAG